MFGLLKNRSFGALTVTQFLGALNDNAFKQLLLLLCLSPITWMGEVAWVRDLGQPLGLALFTLPFVLLAATTGTLADRVSKSRIITFSKWGEVFVMGFALAAFLMQSVIALFVAIFLMGAQSAIFSPSKYGSIPEMLEAKDLSRGNSLIQVTTMLAIIGGTALGGFLLQNFSGSLWVPGTAFVAIALVGTFAAHFIAPLAPADPTRKLTWNAPRSSIITGARPTGIVRSCSP